MIEITEAQIMSSWKYQGSPLVSIICITYNQEKYITDAIEGFLIQKTDFPFEIIVQDDASTDNTPEIIKYYVEKYPNIIKPIFQKENQFSQYRKNILLEAIPYAHGEYIAICEGDDYWTNPHKLNIQIMEMQKHPECNVSFHPVWRQYLKRGKQKFSVHAPCNKVFMTNELILGEGGFCPTASFVFKKCVFKSIPEWFLDAPIGDYFLQILGSLNAGALYINQIMAVYRVGTVGSWSERISQDENYVYDYFIRMLKSLDDVNLYTKNKYLNEFNVINKKICFSMCRNPLLSIEKREAIFSKNKNKFSLINKIMWHLVYKHKNLCEIVFKLKYYIWN